MGSELSWDCLPFIWKRGEGGKPTCLSSLVSFLSLRPSGSLLTPGAGYLIPPIVVHRIADERRLPSKETMRNELAEKQEQLRRSVYEPFEIRRYALSLSRRRTLTNRFASQSFRRSWRCRVLPKRPHRSPPHEIDFRPPTFLKGSDEAVRRALEKDRSIEGDAAQESLDARGGERGCGEFRGGGVERGVGAGAMKKLEEWEKREQGKDIRGLGIE